MNAIKLKTPERKLAANRRYRDRNREAVLYHKRNARLRRFGWEPADLTEALERQDYCCAVCKKGPLSWAGRSNMSAHIDHDHATGKVRGILCKRCNTLCGYIEKDVDALINALRYLDDYGFDFFNAQGIMKAKERE